MVFGMPDAKLTHAASPKRRFGQVDLTSRAGDVMKDMDESLGKRVHSGSGKSIQFLDRSIQSLVWTSVASLITLPISKIVSPRFSASFPPYLLTGG
jgi:hypothetical protein